MPTEDDALRAELEEACARMRRQIELMQKSQRYMGGSASDRRVMRLLRERLGELEEALASLGPR